MDLRSDFDADWTFFDNVENVTFVPIANDGAPNTAEQVANVKALRGYVDSRTYQAFSTVAVQPTDVPMYLWQTTMGGKIAEPGSQVVDADGNRYNVQSAMTDGIVYSCLLRQIRANE